MSEIIFTYLVTSINKLITLECVTPVRQTTRNNVSPSFYVSIRWSTCRMSEECKIDTSFDLSSHFFLNWLFSWEFGKEVFSQNWNEELNKEIHLSKKKFQRLKLKLYHFHRKWRSITNVKPVFYVFKGKQLE